jgi:endonuclease/exonuclease/phosphatase family metal-dependent hydrolase
LTLPTDCLNCIASEPQGSLEQVLERCIDNSDSRQGQVSIDTPYGGLMAYGGSFGTGLLLREQPLETAVLPFESSVNARGALFARVRSAELGTIPIFATHLSPGGEEQHPQVERLIAWIAEKAGAGAAILLGDLNTTPDSVLFKRLRRAGFHEGGVTDERGTYSSSGLASGRFSDSGWRLDHVLVRGQELIASTERIFDQPVTLEVTGRLTASTLSDHAGLLSVISRRPSG